jgi:hypothetical protein
MPTVSFRCPNPECRQLLAIPDDLRGPQARCAKCGHLFSAPLLSVLRMWEPARNDEPRRKAG